MKKITYTIILLLVANVSHSQISEQTKNKIKVQFLRAQDNYKSAKYLDAIKNIDEIENLLNGIRNPSAQNLKVKCLIGAKRYKKAQKELEVLYGLNPSQNILKDIASYEYKIQEGFKSEKLRIERERLAEIRRKEQIRLANIKKREKEKRDRERRIAANAEKQKRLQKYSLIFDEAIRNETLEIDIEYGRLNFIFRNNGNSELQGMSAKDLTSLYNQVSEFETKTIEGRKRYFKRKIELNEANINKYNLSTKYVPFSIYKVNSDKAIKSQPNFYYSKSYDLQFLGYVNKDGEVFFKNLKSRFSSSYNIYANWFSEGMAIVKKESNILFIDENGRVIADLRNKLKALGIGYGYCKDNRVVFKPGNNYLRKKYGNFIVLNKNGEVIFSKPYSSNIRAEENTYSDGLLAISSWDSSGTKYGFLDANGELVIPAIYVGYMSPGFKDGKAIVIKGKKKKRKAIEINKKGEIIREIITPKKFKVFNYNFKWVFYNEKTRETLPIE